MRVESEKFDSTDSQRIDAETIKRDNKKEKPSLPTGKPSNAELNAEYAFVLLDGKDFVLNTKTVTFSPVGSIKNYLANRFAYDDNGDAIGHHGAGRFIHHSAFDVWMKSPGRRTYSEIVFAPNQKEKPHQFNLYRGLSVDPVAGECGLILAHIFNIWCRGNPEAFEYVKCWMARMVQQPGKQAQSIITLASDEGTGKGLITDMLADFFKHHHLIATHQRDVVGRFNDKLATSIFVCMNEAIWGGKKEDEGILKTLATDKTLAIEKKFIQKFSVQNCTHIIITSNNSWYAPLDKTDRRYLTLQLDNDIIGNHAYFDALIAEIESGGREAFLDFLLNYDISNFQPKLIPKINSGERARLKVAGLDSLTTWLVDLIDAQEMTTTSNDGLDIIDVSQWRAMPIEITCKELRDDYHSYARRLNRHVESGKAFGTFIKEIFSLTKRTRLGVSGRPFTYILPKLSECRDVITAHLGGDSPFDDDEIETTEAKHET